jgi:hypothetical protein
MTATTAQPLVRGDATWLRLVRAGIGVAIVGLAILGLTLTFWTTVSEGDFRYAADYWLTMAALPLGVGLMLHTFGFHRLQHGRDGRLGAVGTWLYLLCSAELVVQCMASVVVGAEIRWGPSYPLCAVGTFVGLALLAAGSWRVGLAPRWMLGVWPVLALFGSWGGQGPIPLVFALFLVLYGVVIGQRVGVGRG